MMLAMIGDEDMEGPWVLFPRPWPEESWLPLAAITIVVLLLPLLFVLRRFLRVPSISRRTKHTVIGSCIASGLAAAAIFGVDVGLYLALGLTLQVTASVIWSERCQALLHDPAWLRIATAVSGVVLAFGAFAILVGIQQVLAYLFRGPISLSELEVFLKQTVVPILGAFTLVASFAAVQHMRAYFRAREWQLARETGEPPELPEPEPDATNAPPNEPS